MTVKRLIFVILLGVSPALVSTGLAQESTNSVSETAVIDDVGESVGESFFSGKKPSQLVENWTSPDQLSSSLEIMLLLTVLRLDQAGFQDLLTKELTFQCLKNHRICGKKSMNSLKMTI